MPNYPYTFQLPPLNVQDIPNDGVAGEFLGINGSGVLDWLTAGGTGDMLKADNLSGLTSYPTARTNLGLGTGDSPTFANLTLTSPSLTSDAPVTISQTWSTTGTYTAAKINVTETATANPLSNLLDLQVGGTPKLSVKKTGALLFSENGTASNPIIRFPDSYGQVQGIFNDTANGYVVIQTINGNVQFGSGNVRLQQTKLLNWVNGATTLVALLDEGANTLALRNGANAQTFNVYGTYTSGTSYERLTLSAPSAANAIIGTNKGSGGGTARGLDLQTDGVARMTITTAGDVGIGTTAPLERLHVLGGKVLFGDATDSTGTAGNGDLTLRAWRAPQLNMVANNTSGEPFGLNLKAGATTLAGMSLNTGSGELKIGALSNGGYFPTFYSNNAEVMRFSTTGNVGIGTTSPTSKLQVTGGDVEIETVTSGIIMKAAGTATRYRITLNAGGTDLVFTAI